MNNVQERYFPVCYSHELKNKPIGVQLFDTPLVLFRDLEGEVQVLYDRCPHRGAPLSKGKLLKGILSCPYHGWEFSASGECTKIPGMSCLKKRSLYQVQKYSSYEKYGLIWVCLVHTIFAVPYVPELLNKCYSKFSFEDTVNTGFLEVIENVLDPMHTHFVHSGWIRNNQDLKPLKVLVSTSKQKVEATYLQEDNQQGIIYKLLTMGRTVTQAVGRYVYPNVVQLEYQTNKKDHLLITGFLSPMSCDLTKIFLFTSCKTKLPFSLVQGFMKYLFKVAFKQDKKILSLVADHTKKYPNLGKHVSTYVDLVGPYVKKLLGGESLLNTQKEIIINV